MEDEFQNYPEEGLADAPDTGTSPNEINEDPTHLIPSENAWVSSDGGITNVSDPEQGVPYDFCITIANSGEMDSGAFVVKFVLSGDQDPALELFTEELDNLQPGDYRIAVYHFGSFDNKFGIYHVQAIICTPDGNNELSTDQGFDFTINTQ